ncbi:MAG TPA: SRPBCC family protein [Pseudonocardiaceae bacterium]|jgi:uncharacterized protein YndB with AHSA1/START domain|nr:SRPBCC family protein [Pseudonocardiaceae bacterium]
MSETNETTATETLLMEREYTSPPERVFEAWTDIDIVRLWFGCADEKLWDVHEWDARVGGKYHVSLDFDGNPFEVRGEFTVVDPPHHLSYRWSNDEIIDVTIEPRGSGSHLVLKHTFPAGGPEGQIRTVGWTYSLGQLGLAGLPVG